jgi:hypothetical protein
MNVNNLFSSIKMIITKHNSSSFRKDSSKNEIMSNPESSIYDYDYEDLPPITNLWEWSEEDLLQLRLQHPLSRRVPWKADARSFEKVFLSSKVQKALDLPPTLSWDELVEKVEEYLKKHTLVFQRNSQVLIRTNRTLRDLLPSEFKRRYLTPKDLIERVIGDHGFVHHHPLQEVEEVEDPPLWVWDLTPPSLSPPASLVPEPLITPMASVSKKKVSVSFASHAHLSPKEKTRTPQKEASHRKRRFKFPA